MEDRWGMGDLSRLGEIKTIEWFAWYPFPIMRPDYSREWVWLSRVKLSSRYTVWGTWTRWFRAE